MKRRITVVSIAICVLVGSMAGTETLGLLQGDRLMILRADIAGVPFFLYALISTAPFGVVAGFGASSLILWLLDRQPRQPLLLWMIELTTCGALAGVLIGVALGRSDPNHVLPIKLASTAGAVCGIFLGAYGWYEALRRRSA